jgi:enoyl-CoA hydratase
MPYETVEYEVADHVARVWMNRPEVRNAQNGRMILELDHAFKQAALDDDVRVIVLGGRGPSFSAGHDLKRTVEGKAEPEIARLVSTSEGRLKHELSIYYEKCLAIRDIPKPTIAQVQGHCIAAGLMLAAMCDLVIASDDATFSNPVLRMAAIGAEILVEPWEFGVRKAKELLFTGRALGAEEACQFGFVSRVVPAGELRAAVDELAAEIARMPPVAVSLMKRSFNATLDSMGQREAWDKHFFIHQLGHATAEWKEVTGSILGTDMKNYLKKRDARPVKAAGTGTLT